MKSPAATRTKKPRAGKSLAGLEKEKKKLNEYIRDKVNQLLTVMGTKALDEHELDESDFLQLDPIGIIALSFEQVLEHLKETNKSLGVAKNQLQAVFDTAGVCISIVDSDMRIVNCNEKQKELLVSDRDEIIGHHCYEVYCGKESPSLDCPAIETLATGRPVLVREVKKKSRHFQIVTSALKDKAGNITGVIEVSMDVTEKKKAEEAMRQAEKLSAIGLLAAGVAHELNNPLGNILGYALLALKDPALQADQREKLEIIVEQAKKGSEIVKGLLNFSRQSQPLFEEISIEDVIRKALKNLSSRLLAQSVEVTLDIGDMPRVMADPKQMEIVLMNLLINSMQALEGRPDGLIKIAAGKKDGFLEVSIKDNGPGIPKELLPDIFDPFCTTKPVGQGVGLGLSICSGIIKKHNGSISAGSAEGAVFAFAIPLERKN